MADATPPNPVINKAADAEPRMMLRKLVMFPSRNFVFDERKVIRGMPKDDLANK